ncbi:hypothetical protein RTE01_06880 [Raoultella terrigena]|jgi:DNA-binding winged helix-turn-helix (wHTH) protein|uniref:hypothetical protein n=1 Tax=Raoultella terrigena TaxID=577 RepID=UPI00106A0F45|nr:hypothetical protein [Raoultella terrigena]GEC66053.1 hypothetical protein RTE01_06880 [Raoultella terrigena]
MDITTPLKVYGYIIDPGILIDLEGAMLVKYILHKNGKSFVWAMSPLKKGPLSLISFLLKNSRKGPIAKRVLLQEAFDEAGLCTSQQRLWQIIKELQSCLEQVGAPENLIVNHPRRGVSVEYSYIRRLYVEPEEILL